MRAETAAAVASIRDRLLALEPGLQSVDVLPMRVAVADSIARQRFNAVLTGGFGAIALILTLVGLYGMLADAVSRRVHEIGIRMALGARSHRVLGLVMAQAMVTVGLGVVIGLAGAVAAGNVLQTMAYEVSPTDPRLLTAVAGAFAVVALLACVAPARRATRVDPMEALRGEE